MRLSTKLFLFIGAMLLVMCLAIYFLPVLIMKRQIAEERVQFLERTKEERRETEERYSMWLEEEISSAKATIDAFLFLVSGHAKVKQDLLPTGPDSNAVWLKAAQLLAYSDQIDFLQIEDEEGDVVGITLSTAALYRAKQLPVQGALSWLVLESLEDHPNRHPYIGVWLVSPDEDESIPLVPTLSTPEIFLLFDPVKMIQNPTLYTDKLTAFQKETEGKDLDVAHKVTLQLLQHLKMAEEYLFHTFGNETGNVDELEDHLNEVVGKLPHEAFTGTFPPNLLNYYAGQAASDHYVDSAINPIHSKDRQLTAEEAFVARFVQEVRRANDLEMISAIGFLASVGAVCDSPFDEGAPIGAARIVPDISQGTAVFSSDVFTESSMIDAAAFLKKHPPMDEEIPISSGFGLIPQDEAGVMTMANSMMLSNKKEDGFLTIGTSLHALMRLMAMITGEKVFMVYNGQVVDFFNPKGVITDKMVAVELNKALPLKDSNNFITLGDTEYFYTRYLLDPDWDLSFVTLEVAAKLLKPVEEYERQTKQLTQEFSRNIIAVTLGLFIIGLLVLELISRHFTRPIRVLARATETVAKGDYDNVDLPKVPKRSKNELVVLTNSFSEMIQGLRDREKIRSALNKVVSKEIADEILSGKVHLGGEVREVTVLFCDIRNFTKLSENLRPEEVIGFLNEYATIMTKVIEEHKGVIDKYVGDEIMALFGAPIAHSYSPLQAIVGALAMQKRLLEWNIERKKAGTFAVEAGIAIQSGPMLVGNMGAEDRLNYTVLGANVNLASRICDHAKAGEILIPQALADRQQVKDVIVAEPIEPLILKGFSQPVKVCRVIGLKREDLLEELKPFLEQFDHDSDPGSESPLESEEE